jgi:hypothetical protein
MKRLNRLLSRIGEPAIVFTEYRDTLEAIVGELRTSHKVTWIHGALPREMRTAGVDAFNSGAFDVLVATDAAGEGLNLHRRCRLVVDFELPWNPQRLEQRLGRVDRIGQARSVHAIRLYHHDTIEQDVLDRLALRRRHAERDLDRAVSEREVAASVFTGNDVVGTEVPALHNCTIAAAVNEVSRLSRLRHFAGQQIVAGGCFATARHRNARRLVVLRRDSFANANGVTVGNRLVAHRIELDRRPSSSGEWRRAVDRPAEGLAPELPRHSIDGRTAISRRIDAIRKYLSRRLRREYQGSLFDGREDAAYNDRQRVASRLDASLQRIRAATAPPDPAQTRGEIVAAWPDRRR